MGPTWVLSTPDGPHVGPMNLAIRDDKFWGSHLSNPTLTDTVARPSTEGYISKWISACRVVQVESIRIKFLWVREIMWIPVQLGCHDKHGCTFGDHVISWKRDILKQEYSRTFFFLQKYSSKTFHSSPVRARYGVSFVDS